MANLLKNFDFASEGWHRTTIVIDADGVVTTKAVDNILSPVYWDAWFRHEPDVWDQPEVRDARTDDRLYDGHKAMVYFTFYRKHWGGFLQVVPVTPGKRYRLTAWAHAWSNSQNGPHVDDPKWSEGPGYGAGYVSPPLAEGATPPVGPGTTDDWRNFAFNCGLDPNGGVNPFDASVRWGAGASIYNAYGQVPAIEVTATGDRMTVWLRSRTLWAFKHNDAYWGAASLEEVEQEPEPPEPCQCIGLPRVQYDRTYNVVPANATEERAVAVFLEGWRRSRETTGGSYDDAGIGALDVRRARLYDIPLSEWGMYERWYAEHYPGVEVEFAGDSDEPNPIEPPDQGSDVLLWQCDPAWRNYVYGIKALGRTLCSWGCFVTCIAMARRLYGMNEAETPVTVDEALGEGGYINQSLPTWAAIKAKLGISISSGTTLQAEAHIDKGLVALAEIAPTSYEHFVLVTKRENGRYWMLDPYKNVAGWLDDHYPAGVESWRLLTPVGEPEPQPEPPAVFNPRVLTLHLQQDVEAAQRFVTTCKPAGIKRVLDAQNLPTYAVLNPGMRCVYRGMDESEDPIRFIDMHIDTLRQVADMFEARGLPLIDGHYFWFELWNEVYGYDREPNIMWRDREIAAIQYLAQKEPRVGAVAFNAGVGNIHPPNFDVLVLLGQIIQQTGGMFGLHSYFGATPTHCSLDNYQDEGRWLESRWEMTDDYLVARGVRVNWFLSEGGAIYYQPPTNMPYSSDGWKNPNCLNGNWSQYLARLEQLAQRLYQQNLKRGGRLKAYSIFTQGGGTTWNKFELGSAEIDAIAAMQTRLWPV